MRENRSAMRRRQRPASAPLQRHVRPQSSTTLSGLMVQARALRAPRSPLPQQYLHERREYRPRMTLTSSLARARPKSAAPRRWVGPTQGDLYRRGLSGSEEGWEASSRNASSPSTEELLQRAQSKLDIFGFDKSRLPMVRFVVRAKSAPFKRRRRAAHKRRPKLISSIQSELFVGSKGSRVSGLSVKDNRSCDQTSKETGTQAAPSLSLSSARHNRRRVTPQDLLEMSRDNSSSRVTRVRHDIKMLSIKAMQGSSPIRLSMRKVKEQSPLAHRKGENQRDSAQLRERGHKEEEKDGDRQSNQKERHQWQRRQQLDQQQLDQQQLDQQQLDQQQLDQQQLEQQRQVDHHHHHQQQQQHNQQQQPRIVVQVPGTLSSRQRAQIGSRLPSPEFSVRGLAAAASPRGAAYVLPVAVVEGKGVNQARVQSFLDSTREENNAKKKGKGFAKRGKRRRRRLKR